MRRHRLTILAVCAALVAAPPGVMAGGLPGAVTFDGEARRNGAFIHELRDTLSFGLKPTAEGWGWTIWMGDPRQPRDDYVLVATPPYRGVNSTQIFGWHFRNADNTGSNEVGFKTVNAPQEVRPFRFVDTPEHYAAARQALEIALWGGDRGKAETDAARDFLLADEGWGQGVLEIAELELGNLVPHQRAWIERMAFTVTLTPFRE